MDGWSTIRANLKASGNWYVDYPPPNADNISKDVAHQMLIVHSNADLDIDWVSNKLLSYGIAVQPLPKKDTTPNVYYFIIMIPSQEKGRSYFNVPYTPNFIKWLLSAELVAVHKADITHMLRIWQNELEEKWPLPFFTPSLEIYDKLDQVKSIQLRSGWCFYPNDIIQPGRWVMVRLKYNKEVMPSRSQAVDMIEFLGHECVDPASGVTGWFTQLTDWGNYEDEIVLVMKPSHAISSDQLKTDLYGSAPITVDLCTSERLEAFQGTAGFMYTTNRAVKSSGKVVEQSINTIGELADVLNDMLTFLGKMAPLLWVALGGLVLYFGYQGYKFLRGKPEKNVKPKWFLSKRGAR